MSAIPIIYENPARLWSLKSLSIVDIGASFFYIIIVLGIVFMIRNSKKDSIYRYYAPFFLFKMITCIGFVLFYVYYYGGGDTTAYWSASNSLLDLFLKDLSSFWDVLFLNGQSVNVNQIFYSRGIPIAGWIGKEPEGFFLSKIAFIFNALSFRNYLLASLFFATWGTIVQWKFYRFIRENYIQNTSNNTHLLILFIPSIAFWCGGMTKDTVVLIGLLSISMHLLKWFDLKQRSFTSILWILFYGFLIIKVREIALIVLLASFGLMWMLTLVNNVGSKFLKNLLRIFIMLIGFGVVLLSISLTGIGNTLDSYVQEAEVTQKDFARNTTYGGVKYNIGLSDFSIGGMIKASPLAVIAGIYRPFIWEAVSVTLILNGIEGLILLYLTWKNIIRKGRKFFSGVFDNKIILFSLTFAIIFGFSTGLTAVIFGVLVRLRAPLLIFFAIVLCWEEIQNPTLNNLGTNEQQNI